MSAFRSTGGPLKALAWSTLRTSKMFTNSASGTTSRNAFATWSSCRFSKVNPNPSSEQQPTSKPEASLDPFGFEDVMESNEKASVLVQGFYSEKEKMGSESQSNTPPTPAHRAPAPHRKPVEEEDPAKNVRLLEYESWIRCRATAESNTFTENPDAENMESVREAHFGKIRVDSDNLANQIRDADFNINHNLRTGRRPARREVPMKGEGEQEPVVETIEADHSVRMRASDFLKQYKEKAGAGLTENEEPRERGSVIIEKIEPPRNSHEGDPNNLDRYHNAVEAAAILDARTIPKEYLMPNFNHITELDMWNILSKSVVFQNDFLLAINKPFGVPVHSKALSCRHTIIQFLKKFADLTKCKQVYPLHRIDKETTGVLLLAKDKKIAEVIKEKFAKRQINKVYLAATKLCPRELEATIKIPIGEGKIPGTDKYRSVLRPDLRDYGIKPSTKYAVEAITSYKVLHSIREAAFLEIHPMTGVTHQIRVHLGLGLGCPVIGDHKYSHRDKLAPQRLHPYVLNKIKVKQSKVREIPMHLHCNKVSFTLPSEFTNNNEPVHIQANIPFHMKYTLRRLGLIK